MNHIHTEDKSLDEMLAAVKPGDSVFVHRGEALAKVQAYFKSKDWYVYEYRDKYVVEVYTKGPRVVRKT